VYSYPWRQFNALWYHLGFAPIFTGHASFHCAPFQTSFSVSVPRHKGGTFLAFITLFIGDAGNTGNTTPTNEVLTDDISVSIIFLSG
ncbi:hypothetical protein MAX89_22315, partial [Escherichia coli]